MKPWRLLNFQGRLLLICCIINMIVAIILLNAGRWECIYATIWAGLCGCMTYLPKYKYMDAKDINDGREE